MLKYKIPQIVTLTPFTLPPESLDSKLLKNEYKK